MELNAYNKQVQLLLAVLPEIAKEKHFAIHGGTAINLFVRDMPRLSVDVDLTYIPIEDRVTTLKNISSSLLRIRASIIKALPLAQVQFKEKEEKLLVSEQGADIKIEVNLINRGTIQPPITMELCKKAQEEFDAFCSIQIVPFGQLFGGKICAALSRQHPRDLFDIKYLLTGEGIREDVKRGFLMLLLSSERPVNEMLNPHLLDQRSALENQFSGMSREQFSYDEYESVRHHLIRTLRKSLTKQDKEFLLSVNALAPDWRIYDFQHFPAVQWKMKNLEKLKIINPEKFKEQYMALTKVLGTKKQLKY